MSLRRLLPITMLTLALASCGRSASQLPKDADADTQRTGGTAKTADDRDADKGKDEKAEAIELSADSQRRLGIIVEPVAETALAVPLSVTGSVQPIESRVGHVRPLARGRVVDVLVRVGDRVAADQRLATFDNIEAGELATQYNTARAELARLRAQQVTLSRQVERNRKLVDIGAVPQKEYEASLGEQQQLQESIRGQESTLAGMDARLRRYGVTDPTATDRLMTTIRAPFAGAVIKVSAGAGEVVESSGELFSIADLSHVQVQAQVYEKDLGRVQRGQLAAIRVDAYPDERFSGRIVSIGDTIDPQTRTTTVRCEVANPRGLLKLDMFAGVDLPTAVSAKALAVPSDAIQRIGDKAVVFVRISPTKFEPRVVELGRTAGSLTEVLHGLRVSDPVVTKGAFQVKSTQQAKELGEKD